MKTITLAQKTNRGLTIILIGLSSLVMCETATPGGTVRVRNLEAAEIREIPGFSYSATLNEYAKSARVSEVLVRLFSYGGVTLDDSMQTLPAVQLVLTADPIAQTYTGSTNRGSTTLYTSARISGTLVIKRETNSFVKMHFDATVPGAYVAWGYAQSSPERAPFAKALALHGGLLRTIMPQLYLWYGESFLLGAMSDPIAEVRMIAAELASSAKEPKTIAALTTLVTGADTDVSRTAINSIGALGAREASPALLKAVRANSKSSLAAAILLEYWESPGLPAALGAAVSSGGVIDSDLGLAAMRVFTQRKEKAAIPHILRYLRTMDRRYPKRTYNGRSQAILALEAITGEKLGSDLSVWEAWYKANQ
ncbi:MAG: HEAT repeat domain-containing protein [bacterium]|nr:HEAT repeat domain-containing protein [bacterium]